MAGILHRASIAWSTWLDYAAEAWQPYYVATVWIGVSWVSLVFLWAVILEVSHQPERITAAVSAYRYC